MDYLFREHLGELIDLKNIKMVDSCNKKVISTAIFIPENPSVNFKTFFYFSDLIKSVETFSKTGLEGWVYRIYVDDMFYSGITQKELETAVVAGDKFGSKDVESLIESIEKEASASTSASPGKKQRKLSLRQVIAPIMVVSTYMDQNIKHQLQKKKKTRIVSIITLITKVVTLVMGPRQLKQKKQ